ncbi:MAG TPA: hypothetical protein VGV38_12270 [Pyrinomonadaceae bacterium]|nr:hypothetical protein [Pyrinomonadaceae bacterium]
MNELETEWRRRITEAQTRAREAGRGDVAEYLLLRAENDAARAAGVEWLLDAFTELAGEANRAGASLAVGREEEHRFPVGQSTMVGPRLTLRAGVRQLSVEAGWPRAPRDGIVRGGGLASARLSHFGRASSNEDLLLVREGEGPPRWFVLEETGARTPLREDRMRGHVRQVLA